MPYDYIMKNIAVYLRTSTEKTKGLDSQYQSILNSLDSSHKRPVCIYSDSGISGAKLNRDGLNALKNDVDLENISMVITYSFSRISRSLRDLINLLDYFDERKVVVKSITENFGLDTPSGRFVINILGSLAQFERSIISERIKSGMAAAKKRGSRIGKERSINHDLVLKLRSENLTYHQIATIAGCSKTSARRICLKFHNPSLMVNKGKE